MKNNYYESDDGQFKRPRLSTSSNESSSSNDVTMQETSMEDRPFGTFLSSSFRRSRQPVLSDKKMIVFNVKVERPPLPQDYDTSAWLKLREAVHAIQQQKQPEESLEVLYQLCENLCLYELGPQLCGKLHDECYAHAQLEFSRLESEPSEGIAYVKLIHSWWTTYCDELSRIRSIFLYLDRSVATSLHGSLWKMGINIFAEVYRKCKRTREKVIDGVLTLIRLDRDGDKTADASLLQSLMHMLIDLSVYHMDFEPRFLEESRAYYNEEGGKLVEDMDMSDYLQHVATRLHQESVLRIKKFFDKSTKVPLNSIVEQELLIKRVDRILERSFRYFMDNNCEDDLSMLYRLLRKVNTMDSCVRHFLDYIKTEGAYILRKKRHHDREVIPLVCSFKRKTEIIVRHSFEGDERFVEAHRDGFHYFINAKRNRATELLAAHIDHLLRNSEKMEEHQLEKVLEQCVSLFRFLQGKDYFQALYRRDFAKRLLLEHKSRNAEKSMLLKLRKECGLAYTSKMEGMLRDIKYSTELMNEFKMTSFYGGVAIPNFKVNVLTHGLWPAYTPLDIVLPTVLLGAQTRFEEYYKFKYSSRQLKWQHPLGVCDVTANYPKGTWELTLTLPQTVILLLFNDGAIESLSFSSILSATNIDELELRRILKSLACGEHKLLKKSPEGQDVEHTDQFSYNTEYFATTHRVRMNTDMLKKVIESNASMARTVLISREHQLDAAIVRIMKARRKLSHGQLLGDVTRQVRFNATAQDVKKRIEILIEKEYLRRTDDGGYEYLE